MGSIPVLVLHRQLEVRRQGQIAIREILLGQSRAHGRLDLVADHLGMARDDRRAVTLLGHHRGDAGDQILGVLAQRLVARQEYDGDVPIGGHVGVDEKFGAGLAVEGDPLDASRHGMGQGIARVDGFAVVAREGHGGIVVLIDAPHHAVQIPRPATDEGGRLNSLKVVVLDSNGKPYTNASGQDVSVRFEMSGEELLKFLEENDGMITFTIPTGLNNKVRIICNDCAVDAKGMTNTYDELFENVTVSPNQLVIFYANKPAFYGTVGGVIGLAALIIILIKRKKSKTMV